MVVPKDFSAKFLNGITCYAGRKLYVSDTYGNAIFEVDLSRKTVQSNVGSIRKPLITFTEPGRISFVSDNISGGDGIASGYEYGKVVLIGSDGKY
ncbi:MAG: hypothetical protein ACO2O5_14290 [Candidatus Caldipriscus sp.]